MKERYLKKSAGTIMTKNVPIFNKEDTIGFIERNLFRDIRKIESINYIYIVNKSNVLEGVLSIKELFREDKKKKVSSVMNKDIISSHPSSSQERTAHLVLKHNIKSVPIINKKKKFLGVVLSDDILRVIHDELQDDISHFAGIEHSHANIDNISSMSLLKSLKHRLPWLIIGIFGGILAAQIIGLFEHTLEENIILASFIPLVVYLASAVGTQAGFFIVRDLAIKRKIDFLAYTWRQFRVILSMGFLISIIIFAFSYLFYNQLSVSLVLLIAVLLTIISSIITGIFIPYAFSKLRFDPANASGPVATILQDIISVSLYLLVAQALL
jgi:magnesium transporter